jgi:hypothetical protein
LQQLGNKSSEFIKSWICISSLLILRRREYCIFELSGEKWIKYVREFLSVKIERWIGNNFGIAQRI